MGPGPYRSGPTPDPEPKRRRRTIAFAVGVVALPLLLMVAGGGRERTLPAAQLDELPAVLVQGPAVFPMVDPELRPATPLEPLLAADGPDLLAVMEPRPGATRLGRNDPLHITFNRPMVDGAAVGPVVTDAPLTLRARGGGVIEGTARWTTRSRLVFHAEAAAWNGVREADLVVDPALRAVDGDLVGEQVERTVVFDGTPHLMASGGQRVAAGSPLPLFFDNPVSAREVGQELMAYEIGGGARSMPVRVVARGWEQSRYRLDLLPGRSLEPGAQIGVAVAPRWTRWAGATPAVARYMVQPRPRIDGVACAEDAGRSGRCDQPATPGRVVDIGPTLRVLASEPLSDAALGAIRIRPAVEALRVAFAEGDRRLLAIDGEWEADQVYEVRVAPLQTALGERLEPFGPLAVRSGGHAPQVRMATGRLAYELADPGVIAVEAIAVGKGALIRREVRCCEGASDGEALAAALDPGAYLAHRPDRFHPLALLVPDARPNRWGRARYSWAKGAGEGPAMAVIGLRAGEHGAGRTQTLFTQRTDLGTTVRVTREGVLAWVSQLSDATPVEGARVVLADGDGRVLGEARTDGDGAAWMPTRSDRSGETSAVLAAKGSDRSVVVLERGFAMGPGELDVPIRRGDDAGDVPLASVFTDRGAYRPGSDLHVRVQLRDRATRAPRAGEELIVRVLSPGGLEAEHEVSVRTNRWGSTSASFALPSTVGLGTKEVAVFRPAFGERLGSHGKLDESFVPETRLAGAEFVVAEFRDPAFRVDLQAPERLVAGSQLTAAVDSRYLFGAPVTGGAVRWSLVQDGAAPHAARWSELSFGPENDGVDATTVASGEARLGGDGRATIHPSLADLATPRRAKLTLETEVRDRSGQTTTAHRTIVVHPAAYEVGLAPMPVWVAQCLGDACPGLHAQTVVVDVEDAAVAGRPVHVRFHREGWQQWWQRSGERMQARRQHRRELVHECSLTSAGEETTGCRYVPERPGRYVVEATVADDDGRRAVATRSVYVAGPDEAPDRDPPGARITVTPSATRYRVGQTAELALEAPWAGELLITVERDGVLHRSRERVPAGGHVVRVPVTEAMVPNAFVSVALVRPRVGPPGARADVLGPDLRFGMATVRALPAEAAIALEVSAPDEARPGAEVTVRVHADRSTEVALWAVDEGILRMTRWEAPDLTQGLYPTRGTTFAWEDLRRLLAARVAPPEQRAGGDGGSSARTLRPREPVRVATPLWAPHLQTDADGNAEATFTLPDRDTEYRIVAVAMDERGSSGSTTRSLVARRSVVAREALPRFVTEGDELQAIFFVTNTGAEPESVRAEWSIGQATHSERLWLRPGEERRLTHRVQTPVGQLTLPIHLQVVTQAGRQRVGRDLPIAPAAHWTSRHAFGAAAGGQTATAIGLRFPDGATGRAHLFVAAHPFLGARVVDRDLEGWADLEHRAARLIALVSQRTLQEHMDLALDDGALQAEAALALERVLGHQGPSGAFGRYQAEGWSTPAEGTVATHALILAHRSGLAVPPVALQSALRWLEDLARRAAFGASAGISANDAEAYGLHVLREGGVALPELTDALYERRDSLGYAGRAHLALALDGGDDRRETLVLETAAIALAEERDPTLPFTLALSPGRAWESGALVEAASRTQVGHRHTGALAGALLGCGPTGCGHGGDAPLDRIAEARAMVAYADLFRRTGGAMAAPAVDGEALVAIDRGRSVVRYELPIEGLTAASQLTLAGGEGPTFYLIEAEWTTPLGASDRVARGRGVSLHRRIERADGRSLRSGEAVALGETLRVRLFLHTEGGGPESVRVADPLAAGVEAMSRQFDSAPDQALRTLLGMGPDDEVMDPRGRHAARTVHAITHRALEPNAAHFYFDTLPMGLQEITYAVRATTPGTFTIAPAQVDSSRDDGFLARSPVFELRVEGGE